jgi:hypothetical protein
MTSPLNKTILSLASAAVLAGMLAGCTDNNGNVSGNNSSATPSSSASSSASASATSSPSASPSSSVPAATETEGTAPVGNDESAALLAAFQAKAKAGAGAAELNKMLDDSVPKATPDDADEMIRELIAYYDAHLDSAGKPLEAQDIQQSLLKLKWPFTVDDIKDEKAHKAAEEVVAGGYKLETAEGSFFPVVDYGKLKRFNAQLSPEMKAYVTLLAMESDAKSASDGALVISWDEVAQRALVAETFVRTYPDSKEKDAAQQLFVRYMNDYLVGLPNTPIFDFDTFKVKTEVQDSYKLTVSEYPDTAVATMAKELLGILEKTNGAVFTKGKSGQQTDVPEVKKFRDNIQKEAASLLASSANANK